MILKPIITIIDEDAEQYNIYLSISGENSLYVPTSNINIPKDSDYKKGYYYRYFYKTLNNINSKIYEINEKEYNKIQNISLYKRLKIKWKLIGNIDNAREINTKIINTANLILVGMKSILVDPLQFWKNIPETILQFNVTNKLPKTEIKKKRFSVDFVSFVGFDDRGIIYILTQDLDIIYTEDSVGILAQL